VSAHKKEQYHFLGQGEKYRKSHLVDKKNESAGSWVLKTKKKQEGGVLSGAINSGFKG